MKVAALLIDCFKSKLLEITLKSVTFYLKEHLFTNFSYDMMLFKDY